MKDAFICVKHTLDEDVVENLIAPSRERAERWFKCEISKWLCAYADRHRSEDRFDILVESIWRGDIIRTGNYFYHKGNIALSYEQVPIIEE